MSPSLRTADYIIFGIVIAVPIGIGIFHGVAGKGQSTSSAYHLGNRQLQTIPVAISMLVSLVSSITLIGVPAEAYLFGGTVGWIAVAFLLAHLIGARIVVPLIHPLKLTSINEYFELRYKSKATRLFMAICMLVMNILLMSSCVTGQALAMEKVTWIPVWVSVVTTIVTVVIYTTMGGIKAVIWTDVFQAFIMLIGIFSVIIKGTLDTGGVSEVWEINRTSGRLNMFEVVFDPFMQYTVFGQVICGTMKMMFAAIRQTASQRMNVCSSQREATKIYCMAGPLFLFANVIATVEGLVAFAYFTAAKCDPIKSGQIGNPNQIIPHMVVKMFHGFPGMPGLFLATIVSANLSSVSSNLASLSSVTQCDLLKTIFVNMPERKATRAAKLSVVVYGIIATGLSFVIAEIPGTIFKIIISIMPLLTVPITCVYLYSIFVHSARQLDIFVGVFVSSAVLLWITTGHFFYATLSSPLATAPVDQCPVYNISAFSEYYLATNITTTIPLPVTRPAEFHNIYSISPYWFDAMGIACFFIVAISTNIVVGYFCRPKEEEVDTNLVFSFRERFFPCIFKFFQSSKTRVDGNECKLDDSYVNPGRGEHEDSEQRRASETDIFL